MVIFSTQELRTGWEFKRTEDPSPDAWLPVARVPSVVHIDLIDNKKYVHLVFSLLFMYSILVTDPEQGSRTLLMT